MLYITGDTHAERSRFLYKETVIEKTLTESDKLFICGDFGYIWNNSYMERQFLNFLADKPYQILWVDGNHENFDLINEYPVEEWCGGKVHIIRRNKEGKPKIIHLMRGQVFEIEGKKIFTFGGAYSIDKYIRTPHVTWWPQEMPTDEEMKEGVENLKKHNYQVDYVITHTVAENIMNMFYSYHLKEKPLNNFLEWVRENVSFKHWYSGHLHEDMCLSDNHTIMWFKLRDMETNEIVEEEFL